MATDNPLDLLNVALARSVLYRTLTVGLQSPTEEAIERLTARPGADAMLAAARVVEVASGHVADLMSAVQALIDVPGVQGSVLSTRYQQLFGHTLRGPVCPFETEYGVGNAFGQPHELADIAGYYRAFGLRPTARVDHVACECEFMDFLCRKEAFALECCGGSRPDDRTGYREMLDVTRRAARLFLRAHLARFGVAFASTLAREDAGGFYGRLADVLGCFLWNECGRLNVPAGPPTLEVRPVETDDVPMGCDPGDDLIQIQGLRSLR